VKLERAEAERRRLESRLADVEAELGSVVGMLEGFDPLKAEAAFLRKHLEVFRFTEWHVVYDRTPYEWRMRLIMFDEHDPRGLRWGFERLIPELEIAKRLGDKDQLVAAFGQVWKEARYAMLDSGFAPRLADQVHRALAEEWLRQAAPLLYQKRQSRL